MCLCCPQNCLISSKHDRVTKYLEGGFTTFIDLDFKQLMVFFVVFFLILKREHESKGLAPASFPLGAEEEANLLNLRTLVVTSKWSATEQPSLPSPDNIRGIRSTATVSPKDSF